MSHYQNLPDGWIEIKVGELAKIITDFVASGSFSSLRENVKYYDTLNYAILVRTKDFQNNFTDGLVYTDKHGYEFLSNSNLYGGELILPNIGASIGKVFIVPVLKQPMTLAPNTIMVKCWDEITIKWLYFFFMSSYGQEALKEISSSTAQGKFNKTDFRNIVVPLPSLSEQERIICQIQSFDSIITSVETNRRILSEFIITTKSKILELAMQGKLVPQDPTDEPAAEMLKRINPKAMIITDNPHSGNMPNGWCLCELRDLCTFLSRGKSPKYSDIPNQYPVFAQKCNLKDGGISLNQARFLDESTLPKWPNKYKLKDQDILVNSTGTGTVGRTRLFLNKYLKEFPFVLPDSHVSVVRTFDEIDSNFIYFNLISREGQTYFSDNLSGSTNQKELYIEVIGNKLIFLPPEKEQKRIVTKIEELYSCLDKIETSLQS